MPSLSRFSSTIISAPTLQFPYMTVLDYIPYNYVPTAWVCILFIVIYALSTIVHVAQAIHFRLRWLFPTAVLCGILEITGWSGRYWSSQSPYESTPFLLQAITIAMAPTYFMLANIIILAKITRRLGPQYCRLSPKQYIKLFLAGGITALTFQIVGGTLASGSQTVLGGHLALGGIAIQFSVLILYSALAAEFLLRFNSDRPMRSIREKGVSPPRGTVDKPMKLMLIGMSVMIILLLIRSIYRIVQLSGGWTSKVIATQWLFDVFDAGAIALAMITLSVFHPGALLPGPDKPEKSIYGMKDQESAQEGVDSDRPID